MNSGRITANKFVALTAENPARIFGLYPQKGCLQPGSDADFVLWNPKRKHKYGRALSHQRTDYNLYEGFELQGWPDAVYARGNCLVKNGTWYGQMGQGRYLKRQEGQIL